MSKGKDRTARARQIVAEQKAAERRRTVTLWTSIAVVLVLFVAGLVGYTTLSSQDEGKLVTPSVAVDEGTAFAVGTGPVLVDVYEDFMCPACGNFETTTAPALKQLAGSGKITLRFHPVAILDKYSNGTEYSTRAAAAAAAAAAEAGKFAELHDVLFANRPEENSDGLSNAKIIELAASAGITGDAFTTAVNDGTYRAWATQATETFTRRGYNSTPTIVVAGQQVETPTAAAITEAIDKASG